MSIGVFFILLILLLVISFPVGGVFGLISVLPGMTGTLNYHVLDVVRAMFSGMNSFTLLAVPLFMVSGMIMAEGGISKRLFEFFGYFIETRRRASRARSRSPACFMRPFRALPRQRYLQSVP